MRHLNFVYQRVPWKKSPALIQRAASLPWILFSVWKTPPGSPGRHSSLCWQRWQCEQGLQSRDQRPGPWWCRGRSTCSSPPSSRGCRSRATSSTPMPRSSWARPGLESMISPSYSPTTKGGVSSVYLSPTDVSQYLYRCRNSTKDYSKFHSSW